MKRFIKISLLVGIMLTGSCVIQGMESDIDRKERESKKEAELKVATAVCQKLHELPLQVSKLILDYAALPTTYHRSAQTFNHGHDYGSTFSPNGTTLASISKDGTIKLWDITTKASLRTLICPGSSKVRFSHDGSKLAALSKPRYRNNQVDLWDVETGEHRANFTNNEHMNIESMAFSPDNNTIVCSTLTGIKRWNTETGKIQSHTVKGYAVALSDDGTMYASATIRRDQDDVVIRIRATDTGKVIQTITLSEKPLTIVDRLNNLLEGEGGRPMLAGFSPDGTILACFDLNNPCTLWNVKTGKRITQLANHYRLPSINNDNQIIVGKEPLKIWELSTGKFLQQFNEYPTSIAFSPDTPGFASTDYNGTITLWEGEGSEWHNAFAEGVQRSKLEKFKSGTYLSTSEWNQAKQQGATAFGNMVKDVEALKEFAAKTGDGASAQQLAAMHRARKDELEDLRMLEGFLEADAHNSKGE